MITSGIDQSLRSTGFARYEDDQLVRLMTLKTPARLLGDERLEYIEDRVARFIAGSDLVVFEGISYGSFDKDKALAGLYWILTHRVWEEGIAKVTLPPATRQKYATGNGAASKQEVWAAVEDSGMFGTPGTGSDDEADALVLAAAGQRWYGHPVDTTPESHWEFLGKAKWPDLDIDDST